MSKPNNLEELRRRFNGGNGERPSTNAVLKLCDELEQCRESNVFLSKERTALKIENAELKLQLKDSIKP